MINIDFLSIGNTLWAGVANHIWQSTLFAAAAWLITLFLKKNRARIRYWIWFSVSIKFLIPFSIIVSLGGMIAPEWSRAPVKIPPEWSVIQTINRPFNIPDLKDIPQESDSIASTYQSGKLPLIIFSFWTLGALMVLVNWCKQSIRVSRMVSKAELLTDGHTAKGFHRLKQKNRVSNNIILASTRNTVEPGVYGIFRPVLLLPTGILTKVNETEIEAIFLHEFEHIRCKDNLIALIHMLVQALFWFHPFVWWAGSRLILERELACDESVLQSAKNPRAYAEGIIKVCEYYFKIPATCASGVIGSNLRKRVEGIMKNRIGRKLSPAKRIILLMTGLLVMIVPLAFGFINAPPDQVLSSSNELNNSNINENKADAVQVFSKSERSTELPVKINEDFNDLSVNSAETIQQSEPSGKPLQKNVSSRDVMANVMIQNVKNSEKKSESFKAVKEAALITDTKDIAVAQMDTMVKVAPDEGNGDVDIKKEDADTHISHGISCLEKGHLKDALFNFNKAIALDPANSVAYVARGSAYIKLSRFNNAISDFSRAVEINPKYAAAYQNRGSAYYMLGMFEKAISDYNRVLELNPDNAIAYTSRGVAYSSQKKYETALKDFNQAIELNPKYISAYINRGASYHYQKKYNRAAADYEEALKLNPESDVSKKLEEYCKNVAQWGKVRKIPSSGRGLRARSYGAPEGQVATSHQYNTALQNMRSN